ncbi:hypothetical protein ABD71_17015 [Brevibacillus laterosporus]|nr:hypothetical protein [Brevibacillus laterosporus]
MPNKKTSFLFPNYLEFKIKQNIENVFREGITERFTIRLSSTKNNNYLNLVQNNKIRVKECMVTETTKSNSKENS